MRSLHTEAYRAFVVRLVRARKEAGLTQQQVADALGVPQSQISKTERLERLLAPTELKALAKLYGKSLEWFLPD
jgi:transcriptional regulator with XRE-family HTH domain